MIIFMGVAGSGKSTQGRRLADEKAFPWLSTGEFLRMLVSGERRKEMLSGKLLQDSEMIQLADKVLRLINVQDEFVLDGFPRTTKQANWLLAQVEAGLISISYVVHLQSSKEVVRERLLERGRRDDTEQAIEKRFLEYEQITVPIIETFAQKDIPIVTIDADQDPESVYEQLLTQVSAL